MSSAQLYDTIGATYTVTRRTEPRIAAQVWAALGDARTVLNVGAGTGSYEPSDRDVTAVEPSAVMRAQRPAGAAPCVAATAESLPFEDQSFDAAMAFATVHHWQDPIAGLREMRRVARRVVVFTCDTTDRSWRRRFWLTRDYLPEVAASRVGLATELARAIGARMEPVLIPWDCADGFFEAYWRRPEAYLDENVRRGISVWASVGPDAEQRAVRSLRRRPRIWSVGRTQPRPPRSRGGRARPSPADRLNRHSSFTEATFWVAEENHRPRQIYEAAGWTSDGATRDKSWRGKSVRDLRYRTRL